MIELGSGPGLVGLLLAKLGAQVRSRPGEEKGQEKQWGWTLCKKQGFRTSVEC